MPDDLDTRLLDALRRLRQLAREAHAYPIGSPERDRREERLIEERRRLERLADDVEDTG